MAEIRGFSLNSGPIRRVFQEPAPEAMNRGSLQMYQLFHFLNMRFNHKINFENIDHERLDKLLQNILDKFEKPDIQEYLEDKNVSFLAGIIEFGFFYEEWQAAGRDSRDPQGRVEGEINGRGLGGRERERGG